MAGRHGKGTSKAGMRALVQYRNMSEQEFDELYNRIVFDTTRDEVIQARFDNLMEQFQEEYDLTELLPNDRVVLENLISAMLQLKDYKIHLDKTSKEGITSANLQVIKELNNVCNNLREDISKMQNDLGITRRVRKSDKEQSVITMIEDLKKKAAQFYEQKMHYIFCPRCDSLLATVWWLHPEFKTNTVHLECHKETEGGKICGWSGTVNAKELREGGGTNKLENLPESMK